MAESNSLKDYIDRKSIRRLGQQIQIVAPDFELNRFVKASCHGLEPLEFTQRTKKIAEALRANLSTDTRKALRVVEECCPDPLPHSDGMFSEHFWLWPLSDFVRDFGSEYWQEAIDACYRLTQCFTAEFAIRPLLQREPKKTLAVLQDWTQDQSEHVRRLCSEGTRPRLPWAARLKLPRKSVVPILQALNADPSRFVQKSVANHLNDLGKEEADWLVRTMKKWSNSNADSTQWIVRHALRNHIKQGDPQALAILGYGPAKLKPIEFTLKPKRIRIREKFEATLKIESAARTSQPLLIDWVMHYVRPNRDPYLKVFKGKEVSIGKGESLTISKAFDMSPRNTRSLYPGKHQLDVQINGVVMASQEFTLVR